MEKTVREKELTYEVLTDYCKKLAGYSPFVRLASAGKSTLGREIPVLSIGCGDNPVLYVGGVHGQEWLASLVLLRFFERLSTACTERRALAGLNIREILEEKRLMVIPVLNPDGVEIAIRGGEAAKEYRTLCDKASGGDYSSWNANARGVDINHNFDAGWYALKEAELAEGINAPAPRRFGGEYPESEEETRVLTRLCRSVNIRHAVAFHSQGEEIYWEYGENTPKKSLLMGKIFSAVSDYTLVKNSGLASHGGFKDWFIEELSRPAFTVELGSGKNPLALSQLDSIYRRVEELMAVGIIM